MGNLKEKEKNGAEITLLLELLKMGKELKDICRSKHLLIMVNFIKIYFMDSENYHLKVEIYIRDISNKEILMVKENLAMQTVHLTKVILKMESITDMANLPGQNLNIIRDYLKME